MTKKKENQKEIQEGVIVFDRPSEDVEEENSSQGIVTTETPRPPKKKSKILTTRDLPTELPNYHGIRKGGKK